MLAGAAVEMGRPNNRSFQGGVNIRRRRRDVVRRLVPARRRPAQRSPECRRAGAAVSGRAAGVPGGHERTERGERRAVGRVGERRHQVGHEPVLRECVRVLPRRAVQLDQPVCADRSRRRTDGRRADAQPVWRHDRRPRHPRSAVLLRRVPGHQDHAAASVAAGARPHGTDARRRLHDVCLGGLPGRRRRDASSALRRQPRSARRSSARRR